MHAGDLSFAGPIIQAAAQVAKAVSARVLFAYVNAVDDLHALRDALEKPTKLILVCRDAADEERARDATDEYITVPGFNLTRMGQIKVATLIAFSRQIVSAAAVSMKYSSRKAVPKFPFSSRIRIFFFKGVLLKDGWRWF